ncbi:hypothetical protein ACA910_021585 [Epithemia clementina (nom. ined.)]
MPKDEILDPLRCGRETMMRNDKVAQQSVKATKAIVQYNNRAVSYFEQGDLLRAMSMFNNAAREWSMNLTENQAPLGSTVSVSKRLPSLTMLDYDMAMDVFHDPINMRVDDHVDVVAAVLLYNAAQASRKLNDLESAFALYQIALDRLLPHIAGFGSTVANDINNIALPLLHNIAYQHFCRGEFQEAIACYELALEESKRTSGKRSFSVGLTLNCIGVVFNHSHDVEQSLCYLQNSLDVVSDLTGEGSRWAAAVLNNIGRVYVKLGDYATSLLCFNRALRADRDPGADQIEYGATLFNIAHSLHKLGTLGEALAQYQKFLHLAETLYQSSPHRDIAIVLSYMGQIYHGQSEPEQAKALLDQSIRLGRLSMMQTPQDLAVLLNRMGNFHFDQRNLDAAMEAYDEGLQIEQETLDDCHPNITVTLSNIAEIYRQKGELGKAINVYYRVLCLLETRHGPESNQVAAALNVVGLILDQNGDTDMALKVLQQALEIRKLTLGNDHLDVASTQMYLGAIYCRKKMGSVALRFFLESSRIRKAKSGPNNLHVCFNTFNIGCCYQEEGNYAEATRYFTETLSIQKELLGEMHEDVALTLLKLGETATAKGDPAEASKYLERALEIKRELAKENGAFPAVISILSPLLNSYQETRQIERMMRVFGDTARVLQMQGLPLHHMELSTSVKPHELPFYPCAPSA